MSEEILKAQSQVLKVATSSNGRVYLVGGTALAMRCGHRYSEHWRPRSRSTPRLPPDRRKSAAAWRSSAGRPADWRRRCRRCPGRCHGPARRARAGVHDAPPISRRLSAMARTISGSISRSSATISAMSATWTDTPATVRAGVCLIRSSTSHCRSYIRFSSASAAVQPIRSSSAF